MKTLRIFFTIGFALTAVSLAAQSRHYNSQTLGMGNGGTAFIDGYHANFLNPANLMINNSGRKPKRQIGFLGGFGTHTGGTLVNQTVWDDYFTTGLVLDGYEVGTPRVDMLNDWFGDDVNNNRDIAVNLNIVPFGFSNRGNRSAFSLATRVRVSNDVEFNRGFAELIFYGFDSQQFGSGRPVNLRQNMLSYSEISIGYAMEIPLPFDGLIESLPFINGINLYAGVAPKYLIGIYSTDLNFSSVLTIDPTVNPNQRITHQFSYEATTYGELGEGLSEWADQRGIDPDAPIDEYVDAPTDFGQLGTGFGLDFGATAEIDLSLPALGILGKRQVLRVGMSITDMGSINYDASPTVLSHSDTFVFDADVGDQTVGEYFENLVDSLQNDIYGGFSSTSTGATKYDLPTMYNFGAALTLGKLTTTLDYGVGFNDIGRNVTGSSMTLGLEYRLLNFIPLRFGTRIGGETTATSVGGGIDFRFFDFTFGLMSTTDASDGTDFTFAWSGLVFRF